VQIEDHAEVCHAYEFPSGAFSGFTEVLCFAVPCFGFMQLTFGGKVVRMSDHDSNVS